MLKVNDYFAGKVKSIGFDAASTGRASVGVMEAGEYTFTTGQPEEMTVVSGALKTLLPGANDWQVFMPGGVVLRAGTQRILPAAGGNQQLFMQVS